MKAQSCHDKGESSFLRIVREDTERIGSLKLPWHELEGAKVVITGASGFIGSSIARFLLSLYRSGIVSKPLQVIGIIRSEQSSVEALSDCLTDSQFSFQFSDLAQSNAIDLGNPDYVLHAASHASPKYYSTDPVGILLANSLGTHTLLNASLKARRFLFVSSSEVYGSTSNEKPISESDFGPLDPTMVRSCYSEGKRFGESLSVCWHKMHGLHTNIVRPFHTYGPGLRVDDGRVFSDFAYAVANSKPITLTSSGSAIRAYCYASDAVAGIMTVLLCGTPGDAYNLANPNAVISVRELAEMLSASYGIPIITSDPKPDYLASTFNMLIPNIDKLASLGWKPHVNVAEGFDRFIKAVSA